MKCGHAAVLLAAVAAQCGAYRMLCLLPYPGKSHHMVFDPLLEELLRRGHNLTVVSFFPREQQHPKRRDVSLLDIAQPFVEVVNLENFEFRFFGMERLLEHAPLVMNLARSNLELCEKILTHKIFQEFVRTEGEYDLILVEYFNSDCMMGIIYKYGLPHVGLMSHALLPWTAERHGSPDNPAYVPGMTLRLTDQMSFLERMENTFFLYFYKFWMRWNIRAKEQILSEKILGKLPPLETISGNASVVLVNTHPSLNGVRSLVPALVEVGGLHLHGRNVRPLPKEIEEAVSNATHGVILLSFGSLIKSSSMPRHKVQVFLQVLRRLQQIVIWKWEDDEIPGLPDNVRVMKWIPQYDILNHPACVAFISHGGLLSMTEAVQAGVPMVVIPILGDQFGNAAHARAAGLATVLHYSRLEQSALSRALAHVLTPEMQASAKLLSRSWRDREAPPLATAAYWTERAARLGPGPGSAARAMPAYQLLLLDVFGAAAAVLLLLLAGLYYSLRVLLRFTRRNKVKIS